MLRVSPVEIASSSSRFAKRQHCGGLTLLTELTTPELTKFRASWGNGPNTTKRKHERLVGFFNFCIANDWLEKNPAARMKRVEEKRVPTDYFTREEFERIVDATYAYGDWQGGHDFHGRQDRMRALVLLMRWSGLAIKDAVTLERQRLGNDGRLFLYRAKKGFRFKFLCRAIWCR